MCVYACKNNKGTTLVDFVISCCSIPLFDIATRTLHRCLHLLSQIRLISNKYLQTLKQAIIIDPSKLKKIRIIKRKRKKLCVTMRSVLPGQPMTTSLNVGLGLPLIGSMREFDRKGRTR